jgi:hypothetical protein
LSSSARDKLLSPFLPQTLRIFEEWVTPFYFSRLPACCKTPNFYFIQIVGGGVQLGLLGTAVTNRPIVPTPGDYDDGEIGGMMIGRGN